MFKFIQRSVFIYALCVFLHFAVPHVYTQLCVSPTVKGFVLSIFMAPAPHCQIMRWTIYHTGNMINIMWLCIASWIAEKLMVGNGSNEKKQEPSS